MSKLISMFPDFNFVLEERRYDFEESDLGGTSFQEKHKTYLTDFKFSFFFRFLYFAPQSITE